MAVRRRHKRKIIIIINTEFDEALSIGIHYDGIIIMIIIFIVVVVVVAYRRVCVCVYNIILHISSVCFCHVIITLRNKKKKKHDASHVMRRHDKTRRYSL